jgi:hypothetical protein
VSNHFNIVELASLIEDLAAKERKEILEIEQNADALEQENINFVYQALSDFLINQVEAQLVKSRKGKC